MLESISYSQDFKNFMNMVRMEKQTSGFSVVLFSDYIPPINFNVVRRIFKIFFLVNKFLEDIFCSSQHKQKSKNSCILFLSKLKINNSLSNFEKLTNPLYEGEVPLATASFPVISLRNKTKSYGRLLNSYRILFLSENHFSEVPSVIVSWYITALHASKPLAVLQRDQTELQILFQNTEGKGEKWDWFCFKWLEPGSAWASVFCLIPVAFVCWLERITWIR